MGRKLIFANCPEKFRLAESRDARFCRQIKDLGKIGRK